ncbi:MAG TPA: hypothetical protein VFE24_03030 [Pirellulales bacterium]|nr:hypothetical protein [Pirellulales bacterium]
MRLFETITDLKAHAAAIQSRRFGVIEFAGGKWIGVRLRPFPKFASVLQVAWGGWTHARVGGDGCRLFYNQPRGCSNFLSLKYIVSGKGTSFASFRGCLEVLDEIARIKRADAIVCDAANFRISDRLLARWGWEPHCPSRWHRNFIKRFYGSYPTLAPTGRLAPPA